jgi:CheY-like chemotaxis protein
MISIKELQKFSSKLHILYVEDNTAVREETAKVFEQFFARVDLAINGENGLEKYNQARYDIVITDINMPLMNGIEMIEQMREIHPEQKIIAISAHDEKDILINMIRKGVSSFILKPLELREMINILYPVCRDADAQNMYCDMFDSLNDERRKLKKVLRQITSQLHTVAIKNEQIETLYQQTVPAVSAPLLEEYFAKDEDQGDEKVVFLWDDCEEITELLGDLPNTLANYTVDHEIENIHTAREIISKISSILFRYTPFLDPLAEKLQELSRVISEENAFIALLNSKSDLVLKLFDAVCIDLSLYVNRFSTESMAMKNIHHIHQPTSLSIQQIIGLIQPEEAESGDIEFF